MTEVLQIPFNLDKEKCNLENDLRPFFFSIITKCVPFYNTSPVFDPISFQSCKCEKVQRGWAARFTATTTGQSDHITSLSTPAAPLCLIIEERKSKWKAVRAWKMIDHHDPLCVIYICNMSGYELGQYISQRLGWPRHYPAIPQWLEDLGCA